MVFRIECALLDNFPSLFLYSVSVPVFRLCSCIPYANLSLMIRVPLFSYAKFTPCLAAQVFTEDQPYHHLPGRCQEGARSGVPKNYKVWYFALSVHFKYSVSVPVYSIRKSLSDDS